MRERGNMVRMRSRRRADSTCERANRPTNFDQLSQPTLGFPATMGDIAAPFAYAGTSINGRRASISPFVPQKEGPRY